MRTVLGVEYLGFAKIRGLLDTREAKNQLDVLKGLQAIRQASDAPDRALKIDDILASWSKILHAHDHLKGNMPSNISFCIPNPKQTIPQEAEFLLVIGFSVADEHYAYGMRCKVRAESADSDVIVRQHTQFGWVDIANISDLESSFSRYRSRLFHLSGVELCLSSFLDEDEASPMTASEL